MAANEDLSSKVHNENNNVKEHVQPEAGQANTQAVPAKFKHRYDWYQTASDVYVNIMIKGLKKDCVHVQFENTRLVVSIELGGGETYSLDLHLAHCIDPQKSTTKVLSTKAELKLRKTELVQWDSLEDKGEGKKIPSQAVMSNVQPTEDKVHKYPSSAHCARDWDKIVADVKKEEKEEKPEGDAALNKLFEQIYSDGNDEVRKAMNKSFQESGGTVLSTNWGEIGKEKVERKPPDGMEWKDYEK